MQLKLTRCGTRAAFTLEAGAGEELYAGFIRELGTGAGASAAWQHPALDGCVSLEWAADGATLLFTTPNELGRCVRAGRGGAAWQRPPRDDREQPGKLVLGASQGSRMKAVPPTHADFLPPPPPHTWPCRPSAVHACRAGAAGGSSARTTLYEDRDERFFVELGRTKDWSWLTLNSNSKTASEVGRWTGGMPLWSHF